MAAAVYTGKVVLLGAFIKVVFKFTLPLHITTWANSYACVMSSCFWDTLICGVIMEVRKTALFLNLLFATQTVMI
jgi:hypothetical protein